MGKITLPFSINNKKNLLKSAKNTQKPLKKPQKITSKKFLKKIKKTLKKLLTNKKDSAKMLEFASEGTRKRMGKIERESPSQVTRT